MSRTNWKQVERVAAASCGGTRFPANMGGRLDFEADRFVGQVKNPKRMSLAAIEKLAQEMADAGFQRNKIGVLVVKRSAGSGTKTSMLYVLTEDAWRVLTGGTGAGSLP
jgi:hypothetical protein